MRTQKVWILSRFSPKEGINCDYFGHVLCTLVKNLVWFLKILSIDTVEFFSNIYVDEVVTRLQISSVRHLNKGMVNHVFCLKFISEKKVGRTPSKIFLEVFHTPCPRVGNTGRICESCSLHVNSAHTHITSTCLIGS